MTNAVPTPAKFFGALGLIPFFAAIIAVFSPDFNQVLKDTVNTHSGRLLVTYASIIFCFMAGTFWGLASKSTNQVFAPYFLSILPALYLLTAYSLPGGYRVIILTAGFILLLPIDIYFQKLGLAPTWWLRLRIPLTVIVVLCLLIFSANRYISASFGWT